MSCFSSRGGVAGLILSLVLGFASPAVLAVEEVLGPPTANFQKVSKTLWRGAAPSSEGMRQLAKAGVKTVVDLRLPGSASKKESAVARELGLKYVHIPMGYTATSPEKVNAFLRAANNPDNQPVFIHCRQGADRTGTMVAIYRMLVQGWSFEKAYEDMRQHHFKPWLLALKRTVAQWEPTLPSRGVAKGASSI